MNEHAAWRAAPAPYSEVCALADALGVGEVLAQVLVRRGLTDPEAARAFLQPDFRVHDPYLMAGMAEARARIDLALSRGEIVAVHGDYDADGITATFLLARVLSDLGADVRRHLPNRFSEGYGVSAAAVDELAGSGVKLLITVDCGITARDEVARAQALGMDVIVTDHHEPEGPLPGCTVVTPKLGGYPFEHLAGVGVAFKLAHALLTGPAAEPVAGPVGEPVAGGAGEPATGRHDGPSGLSDVPLALRSLTDVVAVGTIADIVPLTGENRVLAAMGLGRLRSDPRPGLAALMEVAGVKPGGIDAGAVGYRVAPRLNAAGRLEDATLALDLLGAADREAALPAALRLNELNQERQAIESAILAAAVQQVPEPAPPALVLASPDWHEGVIGIVASRVTERFNRPAILLSVDGDHAKGSGRSIPGFDLLGAVERSAEHLEAFGGHRAACGLRLRREHIPAFREAFVAEVRRELGDGESLRVQPVDAVVGGADLTLELADELELLAPHGFGNRTVTLLLHDAEIAAPRLTRDRRHLQYRVRCGGSSCQAIHFNFSDLAAVQEPGRYDIPVVLSKNDYNGAVSAQVQVKGLHRLDGPEELCAAPCALACGERLSGAALWRELLNGEPLRAPGPEAEAALRAAREAGRLRDRRGRPAAPALTALAAGGERLLVLVTDVARRRPLLERDVLPPGLGLRGAYLQSGCSGRAEAAAADADVLVAGHDLVLARPGLAGGFTHVALLDPPFSAAHWTALAGATAHGAWVHACWGAAEAGAAARAQAADYDLTKVMRRVWRALDAGSGRFDDALEQELLQGEPYLRPALPVAAALRALREVGLLAVEPAPDGPADEATAGSPGAGGYHLERPRGKVDITVADTYRTWQTLFQTTDYLRSCLTAQL